MNNNYPRETNHLRSCLHDFLTYNTNKSEKGPTLRQLQLRLIEISKAQIFLEISFQILINEEIDQNALTLLTSLIKDKFRYDSEKITTETKLKIVEMLKETINKYNKASRQLISNLSLCIAYLYYNCAQNINGIIQYLGMFFSQTTNLNYFFKILEIIPDEIDNNKLVIDEESRIAVMNIIAIQQINILSRLNDMCPPIWQQNTVKKQYMLLAFQSWISVTYNEQIFSRLHKHFLTDKIFELLKEGLITQEPVDCLIQILDKIQNPGQQMELFSYLGNNIYALLDSTEKLLESKDLLDVENNIKLLTDFGKKSVSMFISHCDQATLIFLTKMVSYFKPEDLEVSSFLFGFWNQFLHQFINSQDKNSNYLEIIKSLYNVVMMKCRYKWDHFEKLNSISEQNLYHLTSSAQQIYEFRQESKQLFIKIGKVFGKQNFLQYVLKSVGSTPQNNKEIFLPIVEAHFFSLKKVIKHFPVLNNQVKQLIESYDQLQISFTILKKTYLSIFKNLMSIKVKNEQIILRIFASIANFLNENMLIEKAEKAFCKGCEYNPQIVCKHIQKFFLILQKYPSSSNIIKGISLILNQNKQLMDNYLPSILKIQYEVLQKAETVSQQKDAFKSLSTTIKTITESKYKGYEQTIKVFLSEIWNNLILLLTNPGDIVDDESPRAQKCVKLLKSIMRCLKLEFCSFLQPMFSSVLYAYQQYPICSYIYLLQISITVFASEPQFSEYFSELYSSFTSITANYLHSEDKLEQYQFLMDDFLGMNRRLFVYNAKIILKSEALPQIIQMCISICFGSSIPKVAKSSYQFFQTICMVYWRKQMIDQMNHYREEPFIVDSNDATLHYQLKKLIQQKLSVIIQKMILHLSHVPVDITTQCILDALTAEIKAFPVQNSKVWVNCLQNIPLDVLTNKEKEKFYGNLSNVGNSDLKVMDQAIYELEKYFITMKKRYANRMKRNNLK